MIFNRRILRLSLTGMIFFYYILSSISDLNASEKDILNLGKSHVANGEYYNAVTEMKRYQYIYPHGEYYSYSMLIMAEAYYEGGNYSSAIITLSECYNIFENTLDGEKALFNLGYMRLLGGSPYSAFRTYQEYQYIYKEGKFKEQAAFNMCIAIALMDDLKGARREIANYRKLFADGSYIKDINELESSIHKEIKRPLKNFWVSLIGSIFIPGFGHFYTGKYKVGFFSFFTNAGLLYMIYDSYRDRNKFRMILFSFGEFAFYQYSLYSSINNLYEFNNSDSFYKTIRLSLKREF